MASVPDEERRERALQTKRKVTRLVPDIPFMTHDDFRNFLQSEEPNQVIIDCREPEERKVSTIPSALSISDAEHKIQELQRQVGDAGSERLNVVCYCTIGLRSGFHARTMVAPGRSVHNYSIIEHIWGGGDLVDKDNQPCDDEVHVFHSIYKQDIPERCKPETFSHLKALWVTLPLGPAIASSFFSRKQSTEAQGIIES